MPRTDLLKNFSGTVRAYHCEAGAFYRWNDDLSNAARIVGPHQTLKEPIRFVKENGMDIQAETYQVTADELRQFIERIERLEQEKKDIADQIKEVFAESKSRGFDAKALKSIISLRKKDKDQLAEEEAVLELYKEAFGMV